MNKLILFSLIALIASSSMASSNDSAALDKVTSTYIQKFSQTSKVGITYESQGTCQGVVLSPRIILTAGHCADSPDKALSIQGYYLDNVNRPEILTQMTHPRFPGVKANQNKNKIKKLQPIDLGLIFLKSDLPPEYTPVKFYIGQTINEFRNNSGSSLFLLAFGWGRTQILDSTLQTPNLNGFTTGIGKRDDDYAGSTLAGPGASGAPSFIQADDGSLLLVGILTHGETKKSGVRVHHAVAATGLEWLKEVIQYNP